MLNFIYSSLVVNKQINSFTAQECSGFSAMYRTPDGTCNNFKHPSWGSSFMPFLRFLPPDYSDGIEEFRRSVSNGPLPNPRLISTMVHRDESHDTEQFTMFVMQWGQFIDHDITSTPQTRSGTFVMLCAILNSFQSQRTFHIIFSFLQGVLMTPS